MQCHLVPLYTLGRGGIINKWRVSCVLLPPSKGGGGGIVIQVYYGQVACAGECIDIYYTYNTALHTRQVLYYIIIIIIIRL